MEHQFTKVQGQYLAFIVAYAKLNRRPPAEADFQRYFDVRPPSVHTPVRGQLVHPDPGDAVGHRRLGAGLAQAGRDLTAVTNR